MELPNRSTLEGELSGRLSSLTRKDQQELRRLIGYPPDFSKVPDSFFEKAREEMEATLVAALFLIFIQAADFHSPDWFDAAGELGPAGEEWSRRRAGDAGDRYARRGRDGFDRMRRRWEPVDPDQITKDDLAEELENVFGASTAERIAATELTAAQTAGGDAAVEATTGLSDDDVWTNHPELTRSGPCENCEALNGVRRAEWGTIALPSEPQFDPADGPPLHDGCACTVEHESAAVAQT